MAEEKNNNLLKEEIYIRLIGNLIQKSINKIMIVI